MRLIHIPTGITVSCQVECSQYQNREVAMKMLAKLVWWRSRAGKPGEDLRHHAGEQKEITSGAARFAPMCFMPHTMVKDHRTV